MKVSKHTFGEYKLTFIRMQMSSGLGLRPLASIGPKLIKQAILFQPLSILPAMRSQ
jgi:hypothetical protein